MVKENNDQQIIITDAWSSLKKFTSARIALGRTGVSVPLKETLQFKMAHAHARDAVFSLLNTDELLNGIHALGLPVYLLNSKAAGKHIYLQRPDLGKVLAENSVAQFADVKNLQHDVCITLTDGLSAAAINNHAIPLLSLLIPMLSTLKMNVAPACVVVHGRVAIADETAALIHAKLSLILIGERPGLTSPDSMGVYITYNPKPGLTDESRNCVSNIWPGGLSYEEAANTIFYLIKEAFRLKITGVFLKENVKNKFNNVID